MGVEKSTLCYQSEVVYILVKCKACGEKIDKVLAFNIIVNGKNNYYCSEIEYKKIIELQNIKNDTYAEIYSIFSRKITNTILYKEISELSDIYTYKKILSYLKNNNQYLTNIMSKSFVSEYAQIRYFAAILKNSLNDYIEENEDYNSELIIDMPKENYKTKPRRKPLTYFEDEIRGDIYG